MSKATTTLSFTPAQKRIDKYRRAVADETEIIESERAKARQYMSPKNPRARAARLAMERAISRRFTAQRRLDEAIEALRKVSPPAPGTVSIEGVTLKRVGESTLLDDAKEYAVVGKAKDGDGERIAFRGSYDEADDYAQRNESPDNYERYYVAEVVG